MKALVKLNTVFDRQGEPLFLVGGTVRDFVLQRPLKDVDAACRASAETFEPWLAKAGFKPFRRNNKGVFQTVGVVVDGVLFDITPFRSEDHTLETDLSLRDFTINAMAAPATGLEISRVIDPFGGLRDLNNHLLNTPSEPLAILTDDPLRVLRAVRFCLHFGLTAHPRLIEAMQQTAPLVSFERLSGERLRDELLIIFNTAAPSEVIRFFDRIGVLENLFPEIHAMKGMAQNAQQHHKDVFEHTLLVMDNAARLRQDAVFILGALLHDAGKVKTRRLTEKGWTFYNHDLVSTGIANRVMKQLVMPKKERDLVVNVVAHHMRLYNYSDEWTDTAVRRVVRELGDHFEDIMLMSRADITGQNPRSRERKQRKVDQFMDRVAHLKREEINKPRSPIDGNRVMQLLGIEPHRGGGGPQVGEVMNHLKQLVIDGVLDPDDTPRAEEIVTSGAWKNPIPDAAPPRSHGE